MFAIFVYSRIICIKWRDL